MKKGQILEGLIEKVEFPNKAIAAVPGEDKKIVVKNGIMGQKVRISVNKVKKEIAEGRLIEVLEPAPVEIKSACPHFGQCGGCSYQNLPYEEQIKMKEIQIKKMMDAAVNGDYVWEGIRKSPSKSEYRNKMEFSFGDEYKDGPLALGMHKRGSFHDIVNVTDCQIVDGDYRKILPTLWNIPFRDKAAILSPNASCGVFPPSFGKKSREDRRHPDRPCNDNRAQFHTEFGGKEWADRLCSLELDGQIAGILHTKNDSVADVVKDEGTEILYGQDYFYEELLGLRFKITPFSFFQTNSLGAEVLYELARDYVGDTKIKLSLTFVEPEQSPRYCF